MASDALSATFSNRSALKDFMAQVACDAVTSVPGADGAGVTLTQDGVAVVTAASEPFVVEVDAVQYGLDEGPCVTAVKDRRVLSSGTLGVGETRWPNFGVGAAALGVHSVASFPLIVAGDVVGSINMYAYAENAFGYDTLAAGVKFAGPAAVRVQHASAAATAQLLHAELDGVISERAVIEAAIGVLMFRGGIDADTALEHLHRIVDLQHVELATVAAVLVADAATWSRSVRPPVTTGP